jgi:hypothetical protein
METRVYRSDQGTKHEPFRIPHSDLRVHLRISYFSTLRFLLSPSAGPWYRVLPLSPVPLASFAAPCLYKIKHFAAKNSTLSQIPLLVILDVVTLVVIIFQEFFKPLRFVLAFFFFQSFFFSFLFIFFRFPAFASFPSPTTKNMFSKTRLLTSLLTLIFLDTPPLSP